MNLPLVDRLPEPTEAVDATFDFVATGIDTNRAFAARVIGRFGDVEAEAAAAAPATKKAAAPKKSAPKAKATASKAAASKAAASKAKSTAKKAPAKK